MTTATSDVDSIWFRRHRSATSPRIRLVCLPHAGGTASFFHAWAGAFGGDVEVLVARYPGRQERIAEPCIDRMEPLAEAITQALLPFRNAGLALFGHSMGASLAYEVAVRLEHTHGIRPDGLFVSARQAPHRVGVRPGHPHGDEALIEEVRRLGGVDVDVLNDPDLRELVLPAIRADFHIVETYAPRPPVAVNCPVVGYVGRDDPDVGADDMSAWANIAAREFDLRVFPGDHFYLVPWRAALIGDLADRIR